MPFGCSAVGAYLLPAPIIAYVTPLLFSPGTVQKVSGATKIAYQLWTTPVSGPAMILDKALTPLEIMLFDEEIPLINEGVFTL